MITQPHGSGRRVPWFLLAAVLCHAAPAWAEQPEGESKSSALRFAWPTRLEAEVEYRRSKYDPGRPERNMAVALTARLNAVTTGNEVRIAYTEWKGDLGADPYARALLQSSNQIVTVVSRNGAFLRIEGTTAAEDALKKMPGLERVPAQARQQLLQIAPATFEKEARDGWGALVGVWAGNDLEIGADYVMEGEAPVAVLPGERVRIDTRLRAERRLDCPGTGRPGCLELRLRSVPSAEDTDRIINAIIAKLGVTNFPASLSDLSMVTEVSLVTEPDRLLPHRLEVKRTTKAAVANGEKRLHGERVDTATWTYRYSR
jgi:hypothetical protein